MVLLNYYKRIIIFFALLDGLYAGQAQKTIGNLLRKADKTVLAKTKADAYFDVCMKYVELLKVDSVFYFAGKINELSRQSNYTMGLGKYHLAIGIAQFYHGENNESKDNIFKALKIFNNSGGNYFSGLAHEQLGMVYNNSENPDSARIHFWAAIQNASSIPDSFSLFRDYHELGRSYFETSDFDSAASYCLKALTLAEKLHYSRDIFVSSSLLGESFLKMNDLPNASRYLAYALKERMASTDKVTVWLVLHNYAACLSLMHSFTEANTVIKEFEVMSTKFKRVWDSIMVNKLKGIVEYEMQHYPEALKHFQAAFGKVDSIKENTSDIIEITTWLGKSEFNMQMYDSAIAHFRFAGQLSMKINSGFDEMETGLRLSECFQKINQTDSSLLYYKAYTLLKDSVLSIQRQKTIIDVSKKYETEKKEQEIRILQKEKESGAYLLALRNGQIEKQFLEDEKKSQQLALVLQQNEINKFDALQKTLSLDNEKKESERNQAKLSLLEKEAAYQKLLASKQSQQKKIEALSIAVLLLLNNVLI